MVFLPILFAYVVFMTFATTKGYAESKKAGKINNPEKMNVKRPEGEWLSPPSRLGVRLGHSLMKEGPMTERTQVDYPGFLFG